MPPYGLHIYRATSDHLLFNCHSTTSVKFHHVTVNTLCYSMIHFVYTHVIVMYNIGKKIKLSVSVSVTCDTSILIWICVYIYFIDVLLLNMN